MTWPCSATSTTTTSSTTSAGQITGTPNTTLHLTHPASGLTLHSPLPATDLPATELPAA